MGEDLVRDLPAPDPAAGDHVGWARFDYGPDDCPNPHAYAAGIAAARAHELRGANPFDADTEIGRFDDWDAGWLSKHREQIRASERAARARREADLFGEDL